MPFVARMLCIRKNLISIINEIKCEAVYIESFQPKRSKKLLQFYRIP